MMKPDEQRRFLKSYRERDVYGASVPSDQSRGVPPPPMQKPVPESAEVIGLPPFRSLRLGDVSFRKVLARRRSRRKYTDDPLTLDELAFLLFATQGVQRVIRYADGTPYTTFRPVPSAGARHAFETYLAMHRVASLEPGLYRYLPLDHALCLLRRDAHFPEKVAEACCGQIFIADAAVTFIWSAIPYRMEWRYTTIGAKSIAQDSGHVCQNLYLAAEAIGAGACAVAAYFQDRLDALLELDGRDEFVIYVAPVGKVSGGLSP